MCRTGRLGEPVNLQDLRAQYRGFTDAGEYLTLAARALQHRPYPRWPYREYRAIFQGEMWRRQAEGGIELPDR